MRKTSVAGDRLSYSVDRSDASLSTRFLSRLRRSARKIKSGVVTISWIIALAALLFAAVPGQISNTRPTTATAPPISGHAATVGVLDVRPASAQDVADPGEERPAAEDHE